MCGVAAHTLAYFLCSPTGWVNFVPVVAGVSAGVSAAVLAPFAWFQSSLVAREVHTAAW